MTSFQPLNEKKTSCTRKSLGHLFYNSQVLYILCLFSRLLCHDADFTFIFFFGINLCKVYMNDDPKMTMTYIMANSNVVICVLEWGLLNVLNR